MILVVGVATLLRIVRSEAPLALLAFALALNGAFAWRVRTLDQNHGLTSLRRAAFVQLSFDVLLLTAVLHFSDTVENPFVVFYVFPMIIGAMLLERNQIVTLLGMGCLLHAGAAFGENAGWLVHHPLHLEGSGVAEARDDVVESMWFVSTHVLAVCGSLVGVVLLVRAIVEQRLKAEATQHQHEQLALSREKLAHVGEVSAGVAHAVRNPVHGLLNCVELLESTVGEDPNVSETLGMMGDALRRIESVTRRLLVLMHDAPLQPTPTDLDGLVEDTLKFVSGRAKPKSIRLHKQLGGVGLVNVDPDRLSEALINILDNAVDASAEGGRIIISTDAKAELVGIEVRDEGVGMTADQLEKVFHPFFTTKPIGEGTGLGLAISRRILEEHGGEIRIDSAPGRGTSVRMSVARTVIASPGPP